MAEPQKEPVTIKKYANRRLYNTATSSYVTLDYLSRMVKEGTDFVVYDAKSGDDITRSVLTQIIVEEENKGGQNLLPISFLRQLIGFYGDSLGGILPRYLEQSMQSFTRNGENMRDIMKNTFGGIFPMEQFEELNKQNMTLFENALKMFGRFYGEEANRNQSGDGSSPDTAIEDLKAKLDAMQSQLDSFLKK
ncbi:polyhydroxyalkanoate synthesis repressor PhaR [Haematospirillum jordaniae]|uniref:Polyhydroxyalkanoate biosynthesis repressor PhaR n=1 Tax=Haematospirillum jordaniae TaxID=1549855 RepID=A0A143DC70_9PROT|nr:polyhydroxyalkanoate synthesis repressor PhaR [Haematospirillum jordaniae]AMW34130.1 polyhydroxyalkanoate biosynthesis repressor PhaR [Haematospirillum jordaniae]NKD45901.1 polyhydroxyalkanoate synthesis repressor PhaR [Haematospirillum jordaniae]NKD57218.1 polyhydroxyalkanoate synthesis repressor PhaR [Haematospirillum jordaniae]NKD59451.1 polyhydroxyalkanoate synthesis repressor PhaR [Haematospirillum jordaniae]NKD67144.1 polyhydroxyalkanoate synthesis repressor PhaR [Haematospirillum jor